MKKGLPFLAAKTMHGMQLLCACMNKNQYLNTCFFSRQMQELSKTPVFTTVFCYLQTQLQLPKPTSLKRKYLQGSATKFGTCTAILDTKISQDFFQIHQVELSQLGKKNPHQIFGFICPTATVNHQGPSDGYNPQICRKCPP